MTNLAQAYMSEVWRGDVYKKQKKQKQKSETDNGTFHNLLSNGQEQYDETQDYGRSEKWLDYAREYRKIKHVSGLRQIWAETLEYQVSSAN